MKKVALLLFFVAALASCKKDDDAQATITFENPVFESYIIKNFDIDNDGKISAKEAAAVKEIHVQAMGLTSLKDIEAFVNLKILYCPHNELNVLDLNKNTALTLLICSSNRLNVLDLSNNTALIHLICNDNRLTTLNVDKNIKLEYLDCQENSLSELDVSKNVKLNILDCEYNPRLLRLYMFKGQQDGLAEFQKDVQTVITVR